MGGAAAPAQADAQSCTLACALASIRRAVQTHPPRAGAGRVGVQVGNVGRDVVQTRAQQQRQAQQRAVQVAMGRGLVGADDLLRAGQAGQQAQQRRLHLQQHAPTLPGQHGGIARELQGVAQALFGLQQQRLAGQRLAPPARRVRPGRQGPEGRHCQPALVGRPAAGQVAVQQPAQRQVQAHRRGLRVEPRRLLHRGAGLGQRALVLQHHAQAGPGAGQIGLQGHAAARQRQGLVGPAQAGQLRHQIAQGGHAVGP